MGIGWHGTWEFARATPCRSKNRIEKDVSRRGSRGTEASERKRERERDEEGALSSLENTSRSTRVKASGWAAAASRISDLGSRITNLDVAPPARYRQRATTTRGSDPLLLGDRDDLNFRLIYHGVRGSPIRELSLRGKNPADRTSPLSLSDAASSLAVSFCCFHPEIAAIPSRFYNVINDARASGKLNVRGTPSDVKSYESCKWQGRFLIQA